MMQENLSLSGKTFKQLEKFKMAENILEKIINIKSEKILELKKIL